MGEHSNLYLFLVSKCAIITCFVAYNRYRVMTCIPKILKKHGGNWRVVLWYQSRTKCKWLFDYYFSRDFPFGSIIGFYFVIGCFFVFCHCCRFYFSFFCFVKFIIEICNTKYGISNIKHATWDRNRQTVSHI